ncbi:MAG: hypothetical protein UX13_C0031G0004 [Candidatus Woesebacteria bacterium GW2011_GWB1_45_5]|uniref:Uncharacterized protein n=1 Tax=Candidatus Woesebacteria bacterium GW2011_GWB1_45_5 TaxID=1618581 RepID=A0A0G1QM92_9BACT|nr:MAG: hypothetical protein UX13_C0031G0004 [Candidatus Woesebacteria bacterium GW2011_GWB1_45_5]
MFYIGTGIIILTAVVAIIIMLMAPQLLGLWISVPLVIGFVIQMIGLYLHRPQGPDRLLRF